MLQHTQVDGHPGAHVLGAFETRVTVYSQQVRALNLIYALFAEARIATGDAIAVIGGGVAGLTASAAAAQRGCRVTLFEQQAELLHLFAECDKRWLHPRVYDWPAPGSLRDDTDDLPFLRWRAGRASDVVRELRCGWDAVRAALAPGAIVERRPVRSISLHRDPAARDAEVVHWNPGSQRQSFRAVVLAVGFGLERTLDPLPTRSYWRDSDFDPHARGSVLISGCGDGGLTDLLRACIREFRHHEMIRELGLGPATGEDARRLAERLAEIDAAAVREATPAAAAKLITDAYGGTDVTALSRFVDDRLRARASGRRVVLNGEHIDHYTLQASPLNRFLASRVIALGAADFWYGKLAPGQIVHDGTRWKVTLRGHSEVFDEIVIRHGTRHAFELGFPEHWEACKARLAPRNQLDRTREPIWPAGWYTPLAAARDSSVAPDSSSAVSTAMLPAAVEATGAALDATNVAGPSFSIDRPPFNVPFRSKGERMVGRETLLEQVREKLQTAPAAIGHAAAFQGLGGLGKTQLAVEYAYRYRDAYAGGVIWLHADQDLDGQLIQLSDSAGWLAPVSEHQVKREVALRRLRTYRECLVIFDNVDDLAAIEPYRPEPSTGSHILITSRTEQIGFEPIALHPLSGSAGARMLLQESGRTAASDADLHMVNAIVERLCGLPLALELAGAFLRRRPSVAWVDYLPLLDASPTEALPARFLSSATRHEADLFATLRVSEAVFASEPRLREILDVLTWGGTASMSRSLLARMLGIEDALLTSALSLGIELHILSDEDPPAGVTTGRRYRIHRLVGAVRRESGPAPDADARTMACMTRGIDWFDARWDDEGKLADVEADLKHLTAWRVRAEATSSPDLAHLILLEAGPLFHRGRFLEARKAITVAAELINGREASDSALAGKVWLTLGDIAQQLNELDAAEGAFERAREMLRSNPPADGRILLGVSVSLGTVHVRRGNRECASSWLNEALRSALAFPPSEKLEGELVVIYSSLGALHVEFGDYARGIASIQRAIEICRRQFGDADGRTAQGHISLGVAYAEAGQYRVALDLVREGYRVLHARFGPEHPGIGAAHGSLVGVCSGCGLFPEALAHGERALAILTKVYGDHHPTIAAALNCVGSVYMQVRDYRSALACCSRALAMRAANAELDGDTARTLANIACAQAYLGKFAEGLKSATRAREWFLRNRPRFLSGLASSSSALAVCLYKMGKVSEGQRIVNESLQLLPKDHSHRAQLEQLQQEAVPQGYRRPRKKTTRRRKE